MSKNVLEKIISKKRMPVLFIGSGISKRYLYRYPDWEELLRLSFNKINPDPFFYQKHVDSLHRNGLSNFEINVALGTIAENEFNTAFYERKIKLNIGSKNPSWVKRGISPYKMFLSQYFKKLNLYHTPQIHTEIERFKTLKNKVSAIITTNYDQFLENVIFTSDYHVFIHQNDLFSADSYDIAEIYKIHGCITDANSIIITENDYNAFQESRKLIIAKMLTLFAESPIIFLGYSFSDENVQQIIADFLSCLTKRELEHIDEHFVFISYKRGEQQLVEIKRTLTTKNNIELPITEIQTDNFGEVFNILNQITPGMAPAKIRETRKLVKTIVDHSILTGDAESVIVGIDNLEKINLSSRPLAIAIGYKENILNQIGYGILSIDFILEDILYDNKNFDANMMCTERFKSLPHTQLVPVFKYVQSCSENIASESKLSAYIKKHNAIDKIVPKNIEKLLKNIPDISDYNVLLDYTVHIEDIHKKSGVLLKNINHFTPDQIRNFCKQLFEENRIASINSTHFKRCIMCLDFYENAQKKS